jgi:RNA polymerase sigma factor (sigma-70 family)
MSCPVYWFRALLCCDPFWSGRILISVTSPFAIEVPSSLLIRARNGEAAAFEQLYRWFERPVFTLALRLCGQREEAQDILQETMLKLFGKISEFRGDSPFWGWLRQITVNECLMRLRKRHPDLELDIENESDFLEADVLLPPQAADAQLLAQAMNQLPATTRSVLWLYHVEGYTHDEIAGLMEKTISFSKSQCARGGKKLRELLNIDKEVLSHG